LGGKKYFFWGPKKTSVVFFCPFFPPFKKTLSPKKPQGVPPKVLPPKKGTAGFQTFGRPPNFLPEKQSFKTSGKNPKKIFPPWFGPEKKMGVKT